MEAYGRQDGECPAGGPPFRHLLRPPGGLSAEPPPLGLPLGCARRGDRAYRGRAAQRGSLMAHVTGAEEHSRRPPAGWRTTMARRSDVMDTIVSLAKRRGLVFPSSEIYGGLRASWDYGPLGVELKNNVKRQWRKSVVQGRHDVVGPDSGVIPAPEG